MDARAGDADPGRRSGLRVHLHLLQLHLLHLHVLRTCWAWSAAISCCCRVLLFAVGGRRAGLGGRTEGGGGGIDGGGREHRQLFVERDDGVGEGEVLRNLDDLAVRRRVSASPAGAYTRGRDESSIGAGAIDAP